MIARLYELLTGKPWTTTRSMAAEFGPPPAVRYADQLAAYTDLELITSHDPIRVRLAREQATRRVGVSHG